MVCEGSKSYSSATKIRNALMRVIRTFSEAADLPIALILALAFVAPAHAEPWRMGVGGQVGVFEGPAPFASVLVDLGHKDSPWHVQPSFGVRKPESLPGVLELGVAALWHARPCHSSSPFVGAGVGIEFVTPPADEPTPAVPNPPAPVDPAQPIAWLALGLRAPRERVDLSIEGRVVFAEENRLGVVLTGTVHEARKVGSKRPSVQHQHHSPRVGQHHPARAGRYEVYQDRAGEWRWTRYAANGRKIATSGEGYSTRSGAVRAVEAIQGATDKTPSGRP